jgi:hypothetical protein
MSNTRNLTAQQQSTTGMIIPNKSTIEEEYIEVPYGRAAPESSVSTLEDSDRDDALPEPPDTAGDYPLSPASPAKGLNGLGARLLKDDNDEPEYGPASVEEQDKVRPEDELHIDEHQPHSDDGAKKTQKLVEAGFEVTPPQHPAPEDIPEPSPAAATDPPSPAEASLVSTAAPVLPDSSSFPSSHGDRQPVDASPGSLAHPTPEANPLPLQAPAAKSSSAVETSSEPLSDEAVIVPVHPETEVSAAAASGPQNLTGVDGEVVGGSASFIPLFSG